MKKRAGNRRITTFIRKLGVFGGTLLIGTVLFVTTIHHFLAVSSPVRAQILVVEAWIWDKPAMQEVSEEFKGRYQILVCVCEARDGHRAADRKSYAELAKARLVDLGVDEQSIRCLTVSNPGRHRTYNSALAVRDWARKERPETTSFNVFTLGVHARKSWVLFQRAFGPGYKIGIIAGTESSYPVNQWWRSPKGGYLVLRNTAGYLYARLWPFPAQLQPPQLSPTAGVREQSP